MYYNTIKETKDPYNKKWYDAIWHYNYKNYNCLIEFPNGRLINPYTITVETRFGKIRY